jgi:hypothetical protein
LRHWLKQGWNLARTPTLKQLARLVDLKWKRHGHP